MDGAATYEALKLSAQEKADHLIGFFIFQKNFYKKIEVFLVKRYIKRPPPAFPSAFLSLYLSVFGVGLDAL